MRKHSRAVWLSVLAVVIAVIYGPVLVELVRDWIRDSNYSHGFLIPVLSGFFIWQRRDDLAAAPARPSNVGLLGVVVAAGLFIVGTAGAEVFTQRISFLVFLASSVVFLMGWRVLRMVAFPLSLMLLAIPMPYVLYYSLTGPMQGFAAKLAIAGLKVMGVPAVAQGNMIHLPETSLEVAEACSGIRSLYAFLALGAILAQSMVAPLWVRFLVFFLTVPLSVAGNAFRVWGTGLGAYVIGPETAQGAVHEFFGLIVFVTALGFFLLLRRGVRALWRSEPRS